MTNQPKKTGRSRKATAPNHIKITGKRVTGDDGARHLRDERLTVGEDVSAETAALMVENGLAVVLDGKTLDATENEIREQEANKLRQLHKQRADQEMEAFDRQSPETRAELRETNWEPNNE